MLALLFSLALHQTGTPPRPTPALSEMRKALAALQRAEKHLKACDDSFGGTRDKVLADVQRSIEDIKLKLKPPKRAKR